jgi:hypothetical protein
LISSLSLGGLAGMATLGCLPYGPDTRTPLSPPPEQAPSSMSGKTHKSGTDDAASGRASRRAGRSIAVLR